MKGLRKYLTPFAPDQSGAVSVLYEMGGLLVICDAGGCVGNICGFDEPRWQGRKSAIFSAGLRDMDAIMGRDEQLVKKLAMAAEAIHANFAAIIGTPVPSVIGTDYHALTRMAERKLNIPVLAINTNGMELYDAGASKAYLELVRRFAVGPCDGTKGSAEAGKKRLLGVLGCNPIDLSDLSSARMIREHYEREGYEEVLTIGMDAGFDALQRLSQAEKTIVVSPSGLGAARWLKEKYGIPYLAENAVAQVFADRLQVEPGKNLLIVDQQIAANSIRNRLLEKSGSDATRITVASWFGLDRELKEDGDIYLTEEDQFAELVSDGGFDLIIGDPVLKRIARDFRGEFMEHREFALSGKLNRMI